MHAVASGGLIWFEPGAEPLVSRLDVPAPFDLVVAMSGQWRSTAAQGDAFKGSRDGAAASMRRLGELTHAARATLTGGDISSLGRLMDLAHTELVALGTSTPILDRMTALARQAGAAGAKLTGAGHGGAVIALAPDRSRAHRVLTALQAAGFDAFIIPVAGRTAAVAGTPSGASVGRPEHPHALRIESQVKNVRA